MTTASNSKLILVIEDDTCIRENIREILEEEGYLTHGAGNGRDAFDYLQTAQSLPDLILLDLMMPVMDGWQFRSRQKQHSMLENIPVIVVTADGNAQQKEKKPDVDGWVKKPIDIDVLLKVIEQFASK